MSNIYLTPNFIETHRQKGMQNNVMADFMSRSMNDPEFTSEVQHIKQKFGKDNEKAMASYLDWKVYGTSNPTERFVIEPPEEPVNPFNPFPVASAEPADFGSPIEQRGLNVRESIERQQRGGQTALETGFQATGQAVGGLFDVGLEAAATLTPEPVKEKIKQAGLAILQTDIGQAGLQALQGGLETYEEWKSENQRAAANLEAVVNIGAILPVGRAVQQGLKGTVKGGIVGTEGASKVAGRGAKALESSAEASEQAAKSKFVRDLVQPIRTKKVKEAQVARTTETGVGPFAKSKIELTPQEAAAERAVLNISEVSPNKSIQQNFNAIAQANVKAAKELESTIKANDFAFPKKELKARLQDAKVRLENSPALVGDAQKTADKLIKELERRIDAAPAKGSSLLQVRKEYDAWVQSQKPKAFDAKSENAFTLANRELRQTINDFLDTKAPNVGVKESLRNQSALFNALDTIRPKAGLEADTGVGRMLQRVGRIIGAKNKAVQALATAVGIGGLGAAATFAPVAAAVIGTGLAITAGGKIVFSPAARKAAAKVLREVEKISGAEADALKVFLRKMVDEDELPLSFFSKQGVDDAAKTLELEKSGVPPSEAVKQASK